MTVDSKCIVKAMKSGEAVFSLTGTKTPQVTCLVRERSAIIKYLGNTTVDVRAARFTVGNIVLVMVVFRVGQHLDREYEVWLDFYRQSNSEAFRLLAEQEFLSFHFHGDNGRPERIFVVMNTLNEFFAEARDAGQAAPPWNHGDFLHALTAVRARFPTPRDLWRLAVDQRIVEK